YERAYKACVQCRQRKARCEVEVGPGGTLAGPCQRCRRMLKECVFTEERAWKGQKRSADDEATNGVSRRRTSFSAGPSRQPNPVQRPSLSTPASIDTASDTAKRPSSFASPRQPSQRPDIVGQNGLSDSMMRTVVASGNDALNLLFEAATHEGIGSSTSVADHSSNHDNAGTGEVETALAPSNFHPQANQVPITPTTVCLSEASQDELKIWRKCHFVKAGWFTALEAITYMDSFFHNMAPLSPILTSFYAYRCNHVYLLSEEPLLCCAMLALSSRYHNLPGIGGISRGYSIHHRLWEYCQKLIMRIILGQERASNTQLRNVGSIEALLLMTEWHPRALHFLPASEGWDSCLLATDEDDSDDTSSPTTTTEASSEKWLQDVVEPARRSDRMSWMLLGCALSLSHELGIFDDEIKTNPGLVAKSPFNAASLEHRYLRVRRLLYVFIEQLSSRIGCTSMTPQRLGHIKLAKSSMAGYDQSEYPSDYFLAAWIELTKLTKSASDLLFPSTSFTRQILNNGRYVGLLEHFAPLLANWRIRHLEVDGLTDVLRDMLSIEYQFVRLFTNSLGMQAVVERTISQTEGVPSLPFPIDSTDYEFIQEVVNGSCEILEIVIKLSKNGNLRFCPVRIFLHITTSAIYLLKGLSLGVWNTKLRSSLELLDRAILALRCSTLDDMHLASRYATLLEMHVARLRRSFVPSTRPPRLSTRSSSEDRLQASEMQSSARQPSTVPAMSASNCTGGLGEDAIPADDWVALPFDPSMAPFGAGGSAIQTFPNLDDGMLNFLWNMPL
ncbi:hypothetical protein K490DRAFT_11192, partial [Saccharata proteae CBS 121410]